MAKAILNYTTQVAVERTVAEIARILVGHGAESISTRYEKGQAVALSFTIRSPGGVDAYQLPARVSGVWVALQARNKAGKIAPRLATPEQAARVAWRILKDWIEAQLALVSAGMVEVEEILMPYQIRNGRTFFEWYLENRKALPEPGAKGGES